VSSGVLDAAGPAAARETEVGGEGFLALRELSKVYGDVVAVDRLSLEIRRGELVAFLGPSGCGKTTSLRMLAGLTQATSGKIVVDGRDVTSAPPYRRDMGMVFQSYALFPHLDVARNVAFGLEMRKLGRAEVRQRVAEAIALVRLTGRESRKPAQLSGGQQQRVALARALVIRPSILLLDEPLSNLDAKLRDEMRTEIRDIQRRLGITSVFVTHDQTEALTMCDRVAVINHGRLEQLGSPSELYERPASAFVASFVGRTNRLSGVADGSFVVAGGLRLRAPGEHRGAVEVMIRPHRITLGDDAAMGDAVNVVAGRVVRSVYAGDVIQSDVQAAECVLSVEQPNQGTPAPAVGADVTLAFRVADTMLFPATS
jgi:putative spermidine/putrescine transport system ATP-binding protein